MLSARGGKLKALAYYASLGLMAFAYVLVGVMHFRSPDFYINIMPLWIPWHAFWVYATGVFEIAGGIGLLIPATRRIAAWGIIAMLIGFFAVHIDMLVAYEERFSDIPYWGLAARIPLQFLLIGWAYVYARKPAGPSPSA